MRYNYRCRVRACQKRVTLAHPVEWYRTEPVCTACGSELRLDNAAVRRWNKAHTCTCDAYHHPHMIAAGRCLQGVRVTVTDRDGVRAFKGDVPF